MKTAEPRVGMGVLGRRVDSGTFRAASMAAAKIRAAAKRKAETK